MARRETTTDEPRSEMVIRANEAYPLSEAMRRLGVRRDAMDSARRQGLRVVKKLGRCFVLGEDILRFLSGPADKSTS